MYIQGIHPRNLNDIVVEMVRLGIPPRKLEAMATRGLFQVLRVTGVSPAAGRIIKEEMLAAGGDAAMPLSAYEATSPHSFDLILMGSLDTYRVCIEKSASNSPELTEICSRIKTVLLRVEGSVGPEPIDWPDGPMTFGSKTYVMGIINCTPDSFYDGGRNLAFDDALTSARDMIEAGADILDIGGESTKPGAEPVPVDEEIKRTVPLIKALHSEYPGIRISIDTYKAKVARAALEAGAAMINDISALGLDAALASVAADSGVPLCLMHMQGTPADMQKNPSYPGDVCYEINVFFRRRIAAAVEAGIKETQIVIDPGIGFGKTLEHNLEILSRLSEFKSHGRPLLVGASRKSFIGATLDLEPGQRLEGSLAAAVLAVVGGTDIIRVHDVRETVRAVRLADAVIRKKRFLEKKHD